VNFSLLAYRKDLLRDHYNALRETEHGASIVKKINRRTGEIREPVTWADVFDIIKGIQDSEGEGSGEKIPFALDVIGPECLSSFLLELLWTPRFVRDKDGLVELDFSPEVLTALTIALKEWNRNYVKCRGEIVEAGQDITREFIFSRMWLTRFCELARRNPKWELSWCPVPSVEKGVVTYGMCGEWYLGIIKGAFNVPWAVELLSRFAGFEVNSRIADSGGILPVWTRLWEASRLVDKHTRMHYKQCKRRSAIPNYLEIAPHLRKFCMRVISETRGGLAKRDMLELFAQIEESIRLAKSRVAHKAIKA
jgi:hypothetical protein